MWLGDQLNTQRHFEEHSVTMGSLEILEKRTYQKSGSSWISTTLETGNAKHSLVNYVQMQSWLQVLNAYSNGMLMFPVTDLRTIRKSCKNTQIQVCLQSRVLHDRETHG